MDLTETNVERFEKEILTINIKAEMRLVIKKKVHVSNSVEKC